jgi:membrane-associated PAP2 superfamily phosphatase
LSVMSAALPTSPTRLTLWHAVLIPGAMVAVAQWAASSGTDMTLAARYFDATSGGFPLRDAWWAEQFVHKFCKNVLLLLWLGLMVAALAAPKVARLKPHRRTLWLTVAAMGLGPTLVTLLKDINTHVCPWDLKQFGGEAEFSARWWVSRAEAGRCFPGGHAAGGFSLIALFFGARLMGWPRAAWAALVLTLLVGGLFSQVRMMQGAHFLSHNLWSAAIDWWAAFAVFAPALFSAARTSR